MKSFRFFLFLGATVLSVGLISCKSDESPQTRPGLKVANSFTIKNIKGSFTPREKQNGQTENLTSQILLTDNGRVIAARDDIKLHVFSRCQSSKTITEYNLHTSLKGEFPLFELVPAEVWLESPHLETIWSCDFSFNAQNAEALRHHFEIKNIIIKNSAEGLFSILRQNGKSVEVQHERALPVRQSNFTEYTVVFDQTGAENMEIICEGLKIPLLEKNSDFQRLDQLNFDRVNLRKIKTQPTQLCRVAIYKQGRIAAISPLMWLIFDQELEGSEIVLPRPKEVLLYANDYEKRIKTPLSIWQLKLLNTSEQNKRFLLDFHNVKDTKAAAIAGSQSKSKWFSQTVSFKATVAKGAAQVHSQSGRWTFELPPGGEVNFVGQVTVSYQCNDYLFLADGLVVNPPASGKVHQILDLPDAQRVVIESFEVDFARVHLAQNLSAHHPTPAFGQFDSLPLSTAQCK